MYHHCLSYRATDRRFKNQGKTSRIVLKLVYYAPLYNAGRIGSRLRPRVLRASDNQQTILLAGRIDYLQRHLNVTIRFNCFNRKKGNILRVFVSFKTLALALALALASASALSASALSASALSASALSASALASAASVAAMIYLHDFFTLELP